MSITDLPKEIQALVASNLGFQDILSLCQVNRDTANYCRRDMFWQALIRYRFPDQVNDPLYIEQPKLLFYYLNLKPGYYVTLDKEIVELGDPDDRNQLIAFQLGYALAKRINPRVHYFRIRPSGQVETTITDDLFNGLTEQLEPHQVTTRESYYVFDLAGMRFYLPILSLIMPLPLRTFEITLDVLNLVSQEINLYSVDLNPVGYAFVWKYINGTVEFYGKYPISSFFDPEFEL